MFEQGQGLGGGYVTMRQLGALARAVAGLPPTARVAPVVQRLFSTSLMCRSGTVPEEEQLPAHAQVILKRLYNLSSITVVSTAVFCMYVICRSI